MTITEQIIAVNDAKHFESSDLRKLELEQRAAIQCDAPQNELEEISESIKYTQKIIAGLEQTIKTLKALQALALILKEAD